MPLVIQFHGGCSYPTIVCDWCQEPITDAQDGGYFYPVTAREEGTTVAVTFLHHAACDEAYGRQYRACHWWGALREFPRLLAYTLTRQGGPDA